MGKVKINIYENLATLYIKNGSSGDVKLQYFYQPWDDF